jgi:MbtH protein
MEQSPRYAVIANCEDEYIVWPADARVPPSWRPIGVAGSRQECARFIDSVDVARSADLLRRMVEREVVRP